MDIEELRSFCLSLSPEVTEKFPFAKFKSARNILAFYISKHIFCYFDINDLHRVTLRCHNEEEKLELVAHNESLDHPYNGNAKDWLGIDATKAGPTLIKRLISESFSIIKDKK